MGPERRTYGAGDPGATLFADFLDGVREGRMKVTLEDAVHVAEMAEAIEISWRDDVSVDLPLANGG